MLNLYCHLPFVVMRVRSICVALFLFSICSSACANVESIISLAIRIAASVAAIVAIRLLLVVDVSLSSIDESVELL